LWFQLFQEPKPFLGKRQRRGFTGCARLDGWGGDPFSQRSLAQKSENVRFTFGDLSAQIGWQLVLRRAYVQTFAFGT
jgi:hypothetical protein